MDRKSRDTTMARVRHEKHPVPDIVTPPEPEGEVLAEILQMAEDSARRSMDRVRPKMERAIRAALEKWRILG